MRIVVFIAIAVVIALVLGATIAVADSVQYSNSIPLMKTNWHSSVIFPQFNPALGNLTYIEFCLGGHVEGGAKFESLDAAPATVTMDLNAVMKLLRPDMSEIVVSIPVVSTLDNVMAFDGTVDFGGTSGKAYTGLSADKTECVTSLPPPSDLALFIGSGTITLPVTASGASAGSGAGNILLNFNASASATARVKYGYDAVPEPSALALFLLGVTPAVGMLRRRTR